MPRPNEKECVVMAQARLLFTTSAALCALALFGCSKGGDGAEQEGPVGSARFSVQSVPGDVQCIRITADGSRTRSESFDVLPNESAQLLMSALPSGPVAFTADAFSVRCSKVTSSSLPNWVSDPLTAEILPGGVTAVTLVMRPVGSADIGIDFQRDGGDSGATGGSGGSSATGGTSGGGATGGSGGLAGNGGVGGQSPGVWDSTDWDNATWQ
jgi:uncharacterized membrane protein YgcG